MKKAPYFLLFIFALSTFSCSTETFEEITEEINEEDPDSDGDNDDDDVITSNTPCDFDLSDVAANSTVVIDCILDLEGKTVNLPENVTLSFDGGDIIGGGTLNFSSGGKIAGQLLNSKIELKGAVTLIDPTFKFVPSRWEIVEGTVPQATAENNHVVIQKIIDLAKKMGAATFEINILDAYFDSNDIYVPAVRLPSDFHLKMSENTYLRSFPVDKTYSTKMILVSEENNITISGGHIVGERDQHGPTIAKTGVMIWIASGQNIRVENVHISDAGSAGLTVNSTTYPATEPGYIPSKNVLVTGCTFDSNRSNNISVTDGEDIIIENCKLYRAGIDTPFSKGISPISGIDIEADTGQRIERVIIRDNIEEGGAGASFIASGGNDITISGNDLESPLAWNAASNVKVINNTIRGGLAAGLKSAYALSKSVGNIVSGNTIIGSNTGIAARNDDIKIFDNKIIDCIVGIQLDGLQDSEIYNNTITSNVEVSFGFNAIDYVDNVMVRNNTIELPGRFMFLDVINSRDEHAAYKLTFKKNTFKTKNFGMLRGSAGIDIIDNTSISGLRVGDSKNININDNTIKSESPFCIHISNSTSTTNIIIMNNDLENTDAAGQGPAILMNSFGDKVVNEDSNILVEGNTLHVKGFNNGVQVKDFNGITITKNEGSTEDRPLIYFRGNNSTIVDNETLTGTQGADIEGTNNITKNN